MNYELHLPKFSGPIEKLLELIEGKKLTITELSLAAVTADFIKYLEDLKTAEPRLLADFILVASKLLLIKSRALLPNLELSTEEEQDIQNLQFQLHFYQAFKPAIGYVKKMWETDDISAARLFMMGRPIIFYPSKEISIPNLQNSIKIIFESLNRFALETQTIKSPLVSLEEKIKEIIDLINKSISGLKFDDLRKEKNKAEIVVMFLALLHLLHEQLIKAEQKGRFSDIMIEKA